MLHQVAPPHPVNAPVGGRGCDEAVARSSTCEVVYPGGTSLVSSRQRAEGSLLWREGRAPHGDFFARPEGLLGGGCSDRHPQSEGTILALRGP